MLKAIARSNVAGLLSNYFLISLGFFILFGSAVFVCIQSHKFCESPDQSFCEPCPSRATCRGFEVIECDSGYVNNGYECLETTKTPEQLAQLNQKIMKIFAQNVSVNVNDLYEQYFEKECSPTDFKAAVRFTHKWNTTPGGKTIVPISFFSFKRTSIPRFGVGSFTILLTTVWIVLFVIRLSTTI